MQLGGSHAASGGIWDASLRHTGQVLWQQITQLPAAVGADGLGRQRIQPRVVWIFAPINGDDLPRLCSTNGSVPGEHP